MKRSVTRSFHSAAALALLLFVLPAFARKPVANGKIAFASTRDGNREIYVMNADGGTQTAFSSTRGGGAARLFVMNADGSSQTPLTQPLNDLSPVWSPDGASIA